MRSQLVPALNLVRGEREVGAGVKVEAEVTAVGAEAGGEQDTPHLTLGKIRSSRSYALNLQLKKRQKKYLQAIPLQKRKEEEEEEVTCPSTEIEEPTAVIPAARRKIGEEKEKKTEGEKGILLLVLLLHLP